MTTAGIVSEASSMNQPSEKKVIDNAPPFKWSSLWARPSINPVNGKCYTLPILNLRNPYARNFHLAWIGFFVAFLSWFAFPPLIPEAIKEDLHLSATEIANSNIIALAATLFVRIGVGPMVDRYGPRLVMVALLIAGAIPSGLAGAVSNANGLYVIRFFIGILGGTFVPCQAWTSAFFDKNIVGTANALVGGWGNLGGGATYAIMVSLYSSLRKRVSMHKAWRIAFVVVPVPALLLVAVVTLIFGTDHPNGKWSDRHAAPSASLGGRPTHRVVADAEKNGDKNKTVDNEAVTTNVYDAGYNSTVASTTLMPPVEVAVNEPLTMATASKIILNPLTWLPALAYMTTFGFELAVDSVMAQVILNSHSDLGQLNAGYLASVFGLLNLFTRPIGGFLADRLYARYGVKAKKYLVIVLGVMQGAFTIGFGQYLQSRTKPDLGVMMGFVVIMAFCNEFANGANFSLVPHCNAYNNGVMSGIVGGFGNLGGIFHALIFRFQPHRGVPWIISGILALVVNAVLVLFPSPLA